MRITSYFCTLLFLLFTSAACADVQQLMDQIRADHAVLLAADADFHSRRERGVLNGIEASDYASYITKLHRLLAEDCMALIQLKNESEFPARDQAGEQHLIDRLCPEQSSIIQPASIDQGAEQTHTEQIAALDAALNAGLGEFDELLLHEQERIKAATPPQHQGGGATGWGSQNGDRDGEDNNESDENAAGAKSDNANTGDETNGDSNPQISSANNGQSSGARGGTDTSKQSASGQPSDVPNGSDDDVVARQLREAAEKETDPELKKKLWEEYKKYKQGTR